MPEKISSDFLPGFYSGLSGLQLLIPKYRFPPPYENASRLTYYASIFNSIEINRSFYKVPLPATTAAWESSVPGDFRFTFKLWKDITHTSELNFKNEDVRLFMRSINSIQHKKGCLLIQFPPTLRIVFTHRLVELLSLIKEHNSNWRIAVEFRNKSWYNESTFELLNLFNAALVIHDIPGSATPYASHTQDFMYLRFHGPTGNYRGSYTDDFLHEYAGYISEWRAEGKEIYLYFNNTMGDAYQNLVAINKMINKR